MKPGRGGAVPKSKRLAVGAAPERARLETRETEARKKRDVLRLRTAAVRLSADSAPGADEYGASLRRLLHRGLIGGLMGKAPTLVLRSWMKVLQRRRSA